MCMADQKKQLPNPILLQLRRTRPHTGPLLPGQANCMPSITPPDQQPRTPGVVKYFLTPGMMKRTRRPGVLVYQPRQGRGSKLLRTLAFLAQPIELPCFLSGRDEMGDSCCVHIRPASITTASTKVCDGPPNFRVHLPFHGAKPSQNQFPKRHRAPPCFRELHGWE